MGTTHHRSTPADPNQGTPPAAGKSERITAFVNALVTAGVVDKQTVTQAIGVMKTLPPTDRRQLFQVLIDEFKVDRESVYREFVSYYSFKTIDLSTVELTDERISFIGKTLDTLPQNIRDIATANKILPFALLEGSTPKVQLVTPDPINPEIATVGRALPFAKYEVYYVSLKGFEELNRHVLVDSQSRPSATSVEYIEEDSSGVVDELDEEIRRGHLAEVVDGIFTDAVRMGASDIHIIPKGPRITEVHFRIDSRLTLWRLIEDMRADAVAAVVKDVSKGPDRFERNMAQDGFIQKNVEGKVVRFRVSIIPIVGRELKMKLESIVIRVLRDPEGSITVGNIGFDPESLKRFKAAITKPHGIVVITGPTGSGKSTTLLAAIRAVLDPSLNIITVEDPVEYFIDGTRQVKLNPKLEFEGALRAILRHDPDIVMVGEIRDKLTADLAVKLANTGHLTFSTLHTNDAPGAIARLYKMGIEPFLLAYAMNIIVAQRLMRRLCERCKTLDETVPPSLLQALGMSAEELGDVRFHKAVGCIHCIKGYKGRTAIHETLYFTPAIRKIILDSEKSISEDQIRDTALKEGMKPLRQAAFELLKNGVTSFEEVAATTSSDKLEELE